MRIKEILRRIWLISANKLKKNSESVSKQSTQLKIELNSSLQQKLGTNFKIERNDLFCYFKLRKIYNINSKVMLAK